jgi:hypothetical protein
MSGEVLSLRIHFPASMRLPASGQPSKTKIPGELRTVPDTCDCVGILAVAINPFEPRSGQAFIASEVRACQAEDSAKAGEALLP